MSSKTSPQPAALPSFSALLGETTQIYRHHFFALMGFAGWLAFPLALTVLLRITFGDIPEMDTALIVLGGISMAIAVWSYSHVVRFAAHVHLHGKPYDQLPGIQKVLLPVFFTFVVYALVVGIGAMLIIPGILFAIWFAFAPTVAILEERGTFVALGESREIVRGRFFRLLGRLWGMDLLFVIAYLALVIGIDLLLGYDLAHLDVTAPLPVSMDIMLSVFEILAIPFITVYRTLLYLSAKTT